MLLLIIATVLQFPPKDDDGPAARHSFCLCLICLYLGHKLSWNLSPQIWSNHFALNVLFCRFSSTPTGLTSYVCFIFSFFFCRKAKAVLNHSEPASGWGLPPHPLEKRCHTSHTMTKDQLVPLRLCRSLTCSFSLRFSRVLDSKAFLAKALLMDSLPLKVALWPTHVYN